MNLKLFTVIKFFGEVFVELENTVYSASEDDGQIQICAVTNSSSLSLFDFKVILFLKSTDESSLEGLHHYYNNREVLSCIILFYRFSCFTDRPTFSCLSR